MEQPSVISRAWASVQECPLNPLAAHRSANETTEVSVGSLTETDEGWDIPLRGESVWGCYIAQSMVGLTLDESHVSLEGLFVIANAGRSATFGPDEHSTDYLPLVSLNGQTVEAARATLAGELVLEFSDGSRLSAKSDAHYEAWNVTAKGLLLGSGPGGSFEIAAPKSGEKVITMKPLTRRRAEPGGT